MGLTTKGTIGAQIGLISLDEAVERVQAMRRRGARGQPRHPRACATAARSPSPTTPQTSSSARPGIVGFFGASSIERLPTEVAMTENMRRFKSIPIQETA